MHARTIALTIIASIAATLSAPSPASAICTGCKGYKATLVCSARCVTGGYTLSIYKSDEPAVWLELNSSSVEEYADPSRLNLVCGPGPGTYCTKGGTYIKVTDNAKFDDNYCNNAGVQVVGIMYKYSRSSSIGGLGSVKLARVPDCQTGEPNLLSRLASMYTGLRPRALVPACQDPQCIIPSDHTVPHWDPPHKHLDAQWETHESETQYSEGKVRGPSGPTAPGSPATTTYQVGPATGITGYTGYTASGSPATTSQFAPATGITGYTAPGSRAETTYQVGPATGITGYAASGSNVASAQPAPAPAPPPGSPAIAARPAPTGAPGAPQSRVATLPPAAITSAQDILQSPVARSCLTTGGLIARDANRKLSCYGPPRAAQRMAAIDTKVAGVASTCWSGGGAVELSGTGQITCRPSMDAKAQKRTSGTSDGTIHDFPF